MTMEPDRPHPPDAPPPPPSDPLGGLKNVRFLSLDRVPIRTRESITTRAAWRLNVTTDGGEGTISLIEISPTVSLYRGEGVFLGWTADTLEAAYRSLLPEGDGSDLQFNQLG
jgi:hypothetical protein